MAKTQLLWTLLPYGRAPADGIGRGRWRLSAVVSPRLTPQTAAEQRLAAFPEFLDWPGTLAGARFSVRIGADEVGLVPLTEPDGDLWRQLFDDATPVAGFQFKDMSQVNLRSFPVRSVLGFLRRHYGRLAVQSASNHPTLLPWREAHPDLKGMLTDLGTRTQAINFGHGQVEVALPGFSRFFGEDVEKRLNGSVFQPQGIYSMPVPGPGAKEEGPPPATGQRTRRTLRSDWYNPRPGGPGTPLLPEPDAALMELFSGPDEYAFYQADRFYRRRPPTDAERRLRRPDYQNLALPPQAPAYDFHRIVASFGSYPELLRRLGLVLDFALEDDAPLDARIASGNGTAQGRLRLAIGWSGGHDPASDVTPHTAWYADKERFVARPRGNDQARGLLRLERSNDSWGKSRGLFDVYQVDPDGAALKTVNFTLTAQNLVGKHLSLRQKHGEVTYTTGDRQAVAALRSGGLGIARHGRAGEVAQAAAAAALKNQAVEGGGGNDVTLFAEDVHRGYRVDVAAVPDETAPGDWRSLCARVGDYSLARSGAPIDLPPDEGHVSGASATSGADAGSNPDDHYLHESLFRWTGWSLCAPRAGLALKAEQAADSQLQSEVPAQVDEVADAGNGVKASFKARKGTLPRLRYGQLYRFRARVVDVAGNSLAHDDPTLGKLEQASDAVGYWRFEPVDPPVAVHRARVSEGESLERMVIRSNFDASAGSYLATEPIASAIAAPASQDFEYGAVNERHFVPPKASQQQCETHGLFDPFFGGWEDIRKGYEIGAREAGTLYEGGAGAEIELVTPRALDGIATTQTLPPALPDAGNPTGDRLAGGQYVIHREAALATPWLPDGASGGTAIRPVPGHALPGVTGEADLGASCVIRQLPGQGLAILIRHGGAWPDSAGFRLILAERAAQIASLPCAESFADSGAPQWDEQARTLTLFVAKGRIVRLVYSSFVHPEFLPSFGIPRWTGSAAEADFVRKSAAVGANWTITPFRELTLVHATQAPVCEPELLFLTPNRQIGSHDVRLLCRTVRLHGPSTGKFEIEAEWKEWVDDLAKPAPERVSFRGQLGEIKLAENHENEFILSQAVDDQTIDPQATRGDVHALGDTRFRLIRYRARATTRFREYLPPSVYADPDAVTRLGPVATGPAMQLPAEDDPGAPVLQSASGTEQQSLVHASAPPRDPRVLYVVPTFRWQPSQSRAGHDVTRHGNGLRVWLDRPWFSSGDGELLGVVLYGDGARFTDIPPAFQPLVTQWGTDPFWDSPLPKTLTRLTDFPARVASEQLRLQERPGQADPFVQIVGHRVHWDGARSLWYCDIELDPGAAYMPFARLALVRYQPNALPSARISKVVLAEFAQVLPRRRSVVTLQGNVVKAALHGPVAAFGPMKFPVDSEFQNAAFTQGVHETGRNRIELVLQTRDPSIDSDLGWTDAAILRSEVLGGAASTSPGFEIFPNLRTTSAVARTVETRAGPNVSLDPAVDRGPIVDARDRPPFQLDPPFWEATVTIAAGDGRPRRLMLREFERFYSDHIVPERTGSATYSRRVIEERLVYASVIDL